MTESTKLDRDLALTEISMQSASLAETLRNVILESARRFVEKYPGTGLSEDEMVREFRRQLEKHGITVQPLAAAHADATDARPIDGGGKSPDGSER